MPGRSSVLVSTMIAPLNAGAAASRGALWAGLASDADRFEAILAAVDAPLFAAADIGLGQKVVDASCGSVATALQAARRTGPEGLVWCVDLGGATFNCAAWRHVEPASGHLEPVLADLSSWRPSIPADVLVSRFGTTPADRDGAAVFRSLHSALKSGGRLAIAVWMGPHSSPSLRTAIDTMIRTAARAGIDLPSSQDVVRAFQFGDEPEIRNALIEAGWDDVHCAPFTMSLDIGGPGATPALAAALVMANGPLAVLTRSFSEEMKQAIREELVIALDAQ